MRHDSVTWGLGILTLLFLLSARFNRMEGFQDLAFINLLAATGLFGALLTYLYLTKSISPVE